MRADIESDLLAAREAAGAGKHEEALVVFVKIAGYATATLLQKTEALEQAALCAQNQKKYDQALDLARKIPSEASSKTLQMKVLLESGKTNELIAAFKDDDMSRWPGDKRGEGYYARGQAFCKAGDGPRAAKDLAAAVAELPGLREKVQALTLLAHVYRALLKDDDKALAVYLETQPLAQKLDRWGYTFFTVSATASEMLSARGKYAEALEVLDRTDVRSLHGSWRSSLLCSYASVYEAQGRLVDALRFLGEARDVPGLQYAGIDKRINVLLARLQDPGAQSSDLVLAINGRTDYQVVLPDSFPDREVGSVLTNAAALIQGAFLTNGFDIKVVPERDRDPGKPGLFLGETDFARASGVDFGSLECWSYVHKAIGSNVVIAGRDRPGRVPPPEGGWRSRTQGQPELGTMKAACDFLRIYAGVRFLYPGSNGTEYLKQSFIAAPKNLDAVKKSALKFNYSYFQRNEPYFMANNYIFPVDRGFINWEGAIPAEKYRETHPEYFALVNGRRYCLAKDWTGKWGEQYCLSNPEVRELICRKLLAEAGRGFEIVIVNNPDGFVKCQCDECHKLYDTGDDWCEKVWIFYRGLAERLRKESPNTKVEFYSYGPTYEPPKTFNAFPDNTSVMMCSSAPESFAAWKSCRVPGGFTAYIYNWGSWQMQVCLPKRSAAYVAAQVMNFFSNHVNGVSIDGFGESYGLDGPSYYVYGRMWDDPAENSADELMHEFCAAAFREASEPMRKFYAELHHALETSYLVTRYQEPGGRWRQALDGPLHYLAYVYTPERLAAMEGHLTHAESLVVAEKARRRLMLVRLEFDVLKSTLTVIQFNNAFNMRPDAAARESLLRAIDERNALIDALFARKPDGKLGNKKSIPGWPEMGPFYGCGRDMIGLYSERQRKSYKGLFETDTAAMRKAPLPGLKRLAAKPSSGAVSLDAPDWEKAAAETLRALPGAEDVLALKGSLKALYDRENLYLRFESALPPGQTNFTPVARDGNVFGSESVEFCLDPSGQGQKYYRFVAGPATGSCYDAAAGFISDSLHPLYGKEDPSWNGEWACETRIDPAGSRWLAMLKMPYKTIGVGAPAAGTAWRGNAARNHVPGTNAAVHYIWPPSAAGGMGGPDAFGEIIFEK